MQGGGVDVVLMDIMMPLLDGYDTMRAIRAMESFRVMPIIAVTSKVMAGERKRCMDAGASDYVPKPVDASELMAALRPWLPERLKHGGNHRGRWEWAAADAEADLSDVTTSMPERTFEGLTFLVVDDDFRNIFAMRALLERELGIVGCSREWRRRHRLVGAQDRRRHHLDGHHDACHGRLRHHASHPGDGRLSVDAHHRGHRQGDGR